MAYKEKITGIRLSKEQHNKIRYIAEKNCRTLNDEFRLMVDLHIKKYEEENGDNSEVIPYTEVVELVYKKVKQIENILLDEFPEIPKDRHELIANRIYDQVMYEDKDI